MTDKVQVLFSVNWLADVCFAFNRWYNFSVSLRIWYRRYSTDATYEARSDADVQNHAEHR